MQIANPIYDAVFKYLMEDETSAKILISTIIEEEIISLELSPNEKIVELEHPPLTVYRLDFSATIKIDEGYKKVLIEIQKAKFATDIMRFRRYLGEQYRDISNTYEKEAGPKGKKYAIPILTIYFLGYKLDYTDVPIIKVARSYYDSVTGEKLDIKEEFIESLSHNSFVIQIPYLKDAVRSDTEKLLSVFNQKYKTSDVHILDIDEFDYPESYRPIIRRLQRAIAEKKVRDKMEIEDEFLEELHNQERLIEEQNKKLDEKDKVIDENKKELVEKDRIIAELRKKAGI